MKILALDTSTEACSAAFWCDGVLYRQFELTPRSHTQLILPMLEQVLTAGGSTLAEVDALAFGCGPGAFTGIRIATGVAQGLGLAADKPLLPISTLAALAQRAYVELGAEQVLVALDARMGEVYWAEYQVEAGRMQLVGDELVLKPESVPLPIGSPSYVAVGGAWTVYEHSLQPRFSSYLDAIYAEWLPDAEFIARLAVYGWQNGEMLAPEATEPTYLRNKVALKTEEQRQLRS